LTEIIKETVTTTDRRTGTPAGTEASGSQTLARLIYFLFGALEVLLIFRLIFKLAGASHGSIFVNFIYSITGIFILPFAGIFRTATTEGIETTSILEPATLVAIIVYAFLAWGIVALIGILSGEREQAD